MQSVSGLPPRPQGHSRPGPAAIVGEGVRELREGALGGKAATQLSPFLDRETPPERGAPRATPRKPRGTPGPARRAEPVFRAPPATPLVEGPMEEIRARARSLSFLTPSTENGNFPVRVPKGR